VLRKADVDDGCGLDDWDMRITGVTWVWLDLTGFGANAPLRQKDTGKRCVCLVSAGRLAPKRDRNALKLAANRPD
jgi:hypothetical protein